MQIIQREETEKLNKIKAFLNDPNKMSEYSIGDLDMKSSRILREISGTVQNDLYVQSCGIDRWSSPERKTAWGKNTYYSLHYVTSGEGTLECEGQEYKISKGMVFVVFADVESIYRPEPKNPWSYIYIDFGGILQSSVFRQLGFDAKNCVKKFKSQNNLESRFYDVYESALETETRSFKTMAALYGLLAELEELETSGTQWNHQEHYVKQALVFIKNNLAHATVEAIANECAVSAAYLTRVCKNVLGISMKDLITVTRMQTARNKLKYTKQSIKRVCDDCGFSERKYFARVFKRIFGVTPTEYRNREQKL